MKTLKSNFNHLIFFINLHHYAGTGMAKTSRKGLR